MSGDFALRLDRRALLLAALSTTLPLSAKGASMAADKSPQSSGEFDFLIGRWTVRHRKLRQRLKASSDWIEFDGLLAVDPILGGAGNIDHNDIDDPSGRYLATSLRLFDAAQHRWSIYWIDARYAGIDKPVVGRFAGPAGQFFADDMFEGQPIRLRFTYEDLGPRHARWSQAFSPDQGASWETNWVMEFSREEPA